MTLNIFGMMSNKCRVKNCENKKIVDKNFWNLIKNLGSSNIIFWIIQ